MSAQDVLDVVPSRAGKTFASEAKEDFFQLGAISQRSSAPSFNFREQSLFEVPEKTGGRHTLDPDVAG
jgi:hypothetical protein